MSLAPPRSAAFRQLLSSAAAVSTLCWGAGAQASEHVGSWEREPEAPACDIEANDIIPQPAGPVIQIAAQSSKSAAILGGQPSALELIRLAQQPDGVAESQASAFVAAEAVSTQQLSPAVGGIRVWSSDCSGQPALPEGGITGSDDFLESKRLVIGRTAFDRDWRRVSSDRISSRRYRKLIGITLDEDLSAIRSVNSWVNRAITFTDDRDLFSKADYWAGAAATLKLRRGDCEDIALTKMQLLAAAGIPREDMILTIARDLVRNADHAVLIVRHAGRYYMLDNASDEVFDASLSYDYRPILSFGSSQTWLHGY
jgi:predicted transglutaminase-like cysteine proteinase